MDEHPINRLASGFWRRLGVAFNWAGWLAARGSSFCSYRELEILAECGALPDRLGVEVPDPSVTPGCSGRSCPDGRHCIHYYTDYPARCCDCSKMI